jgi:hypothetical protein
MTTAAKAAFQLAVKWVVREENLQEATRGHLST